MRVTSGFRGSFALCITHVLEDDMQALVETMKSNTWARIGILLALIAVAMLAVVWSAMTPSGRSAAALKATWYLGMMLPAIALGAAWGWIRFSLRAWGWATLSLAIITVAIYSMAPPTHEAEKTQSSGSVPYYVAPNK
jgi:hypothetical protein